jgi:hypothetical protein
MSQLKVPSAFAQFQFTRDAKIPKMLQIQALSAFTSFLSYQRIEEDTRFVTNKSAKLDLPSSYFTNDLRKIPNLELLKASSVSASLPHKKAEEYIGNVTSKSVMCIC